MTKPSVELALFIMFRICGFQFKSSDRELQGKDSGLQPVGYGQAYCMGL